MAGPGGTEVGRVSIKVVPDTEKFRRELKAKLENQKSGLKAEIPVYLDTKRLKAQLKALQATVRKAGPLKVPVSLDRAGVTKQLTQIRAHAQRMMGREIFDVSGMASGIVPEFTDAFQQVSKVGRKSFKSIARTGFSVFRGVAGTVLSIAGALAKAAVVSGVLLLAAGAVQTAVGGIAAGIAGLPVLIATLVGPIATIAAGFDGIKAAAEQLKKPFNELKAAVSSTFKNTLTPVFKQLKAIFPTLQAGMVGVAEATSRFADEIVGVLTSQAGLKNIERMFNGISTALNIIAPAVARFVAESLKVAGTSQLYQILGDTIKGVLDVFSAFLAEVQKTGILKAALTAVRDILKAGVGLFAEWAKAGMTFLTSAAPGITSFLSSLSNFFSRFDFAKLGALFGSVFDSLAEGLKNIPQSVITGLETSIAMLVTSFNKFVTSGALSKMIRLFGLLVEILSKILDFFGGISRALDTLKKGIAQSGLDTLFPFLSREIEGTALTVQEAEKKYGSLGEESKRLGSATKNLGGQFQATKQATVSALNTMRATGAVTLQDLATIMGVQGEAGRRSFIAAFRRIAPGMLNSRGEVTGAANAVAGSAQAALGSVNGYSAGRNIGGGVAAGIRSTIGQVSSAASIMAGAIAGWLPNSPARKGPFSGHGWTPFRGKALVEGFAKGIRSNSNLAESATADMVKGVDSALQTVPLIAGKALSAEWQGTIESDGFGGIQDKIAGALSGWTVELDAQGMSRLVKKGNTRLARRN